MNDIARALANVLLQRHRDVCRALGADPGAVTDNMIRQSTISYGSLCEQAGVPGLERICGQFLDEVGQWCEEKGWPLLNSLAVNKDTGIPGLGYDGAHGGDLLLWDEQVRACIAFTGYPSQV